MSEPVVPSGRLHDALDVARKLGRCGNQEETLGLIVAGAVATVPGADYAGVSRWRRGGGITTAMSMPNPLVQELDELQAALNEGPCVDAIWVADQVHAPRLATDERWPRYARRAVELGVNASLSLRLYVEGDTLGALNLYSRTEDGFRADSFAFADLFSSHAAIALTGADRVAGLEQALRTRDLIGQAKGILMQRFGVDAQRAFAMLVQASQHSNTKLVDVAEWVAGPDHPAGR